ncbi:TfoX/Sxy family protein [Amylibacter sp.]|nr:TfoX/Sxy family protein [Amylibacter sp.]
MAVSNEDIEFATDLFSRLGSITSRKMMGDASIYCDGQIFAILKSDGALMIKAKGALADELAAESCTKFTMEDKTGKIKSMGYWTLPEPALDDPDEACQWATKSLKENS